MKKVVILVVVLIIAGVGAYFIVNRDESNDTATPVASEPAGSVDEPESGALEMESAVITYDGNTFSPSELTVKTGTVVTVKNGSSQTLDFASDDHPTHRINSELNVGEIEPGQTATFTAKAGTWGYHDHLNDSATGTLTVED